MNIICSAPDDLDRALMVARTPGDTILARSGQFVTRGNWGFPDYLSLAAGVRLDATGSTIRFAADPTRTASGVVRPARDLNLLWAGAGTEVIGGTWDATPPDGWFASGFRFFGRFHLGSVTIIGLRGSWTAPGPGFVGVESFAVSAEGATDGSLIEGVVVKAVAPNAYVSGIYLGGTVAPAEGTDGSRITGCDVDLVGQNQHAYSASFKTVITNCAGTGGKYGLYSDTGAMVVVGSGLKLAGSWAAVSSIGVGPCLRGVYLTDCVLSGERCVEWWDKTPSGASMTGGVVVGASQIDCTYLVAVSAKAGSLAFARNRWAARPQLAISPGSVTPMVIA